MNSFNSYQSNDLKEIGYSELNSIKGGNTVAVAGLIVGVFKLAMEVSYSIGYAIGHYEATH